MPASIRSCALVAAALGVALLVPGCCCPIGRVLDRATSSRPEPLPVEASAVVRPETSDVEVSVQTDPSARVEVRSARGMVLTSGYATGGRWTGRVSDASARDGSLVLTVVATFGARRGTKIVTVAMPPRLEARGATVSCRGAPQPCSVRWALGGRIEISGPPGMIVTVAGRQGSVPPGGRGRLDGGAEVFLANADLSWLPQGFRAQRSVELPVVVGLPTGQQLQATMSIGAGQVKEALKALFTRVRQGPVPLPVEGQGTAVALVGAGTAEFFGTMRTLGDVSRVAFWETQMRTGSCGSYGGGGQVRRIEKHMHDRTYEVLDRRTGQRVAQRRFTASTPRCPTRISGSTWSVSGFVDEAQVRSWLQRL